MTNVRAVSTNREIGEPGAVALDEDGRPAAALEQNEEWVMRRPLPEPAARGTESYTTCWDMIFPNTTGQVTNQLPRR